MTRINWNKMARRDRLDRETARSESWEIANATPLPAGHKPASYAIRTLYPFRCECGTSIAKGERAWYYPANESTKKLCEACGLIDTYGRARTWTER
jgi:hypothetical protein